MIEACLFAAYVTMAPAFNDFNIIRAKSTPPCAVEAVIVEGVLMLTRPDARVTIRLPRGRGWYTLEFVFGNRFARVEGEPQRVRYVAVKRE